MEPIEAAHIKRREMRLSQAKFARKFGLITITYAQWERGSRKPDRAANVLLATICQFPHVVELAVKQCSEE